jgi:hypothetical protein
MTTLAWAFLGKCFFSHFLFVPALSSLLCVTIEATLITWFCFDKKKGKGGEGREEGKKKWEVWSEEGVLYYLCI